MAKTKISEWSSTPANNTDIDSINIAEGCAPSGINDAIRELMSQVKDLYAGTSGDIIAVAAGGTGVGTSTGSGSNVLATSPTLVTPILGTPTSATLTNATGLPIATGVSGLGTGVATFLATPSSANLRSALTDETGTGSAVFATSPTLVTPVLGTPTSATLTNATGLPIATGVSGLGTGIATALAVNTGSAGAPVLFNGALGTPSSGTLTNATGLPNAGLVNSSITIGGTAIALGASSNALANDITVNGLTVGKGLADSQGTALGNAVLSANTTGFQNAGAGYQALKVNTTGYANSAFGAFALTANLSGNSNSAFGRYALIANTTASNNSAFGSNALEVNSSGASNTAVGANALNANTTASNNTAVGYQAGYTNQTAGGAVFIGYQAGYGSVGISTTINYNTAIGYQAGYGLTSGYSNTLIGNGAGNAITSGYKNTVLGSYSGNQGGLDIRTASNYIVLSDGDGNPRLIGDTYGKWGIGGAPVAQGGADNQFLVKADLQYQNGINVATTQTSGSGYFTGWIYNGTSIGNIYSAAGVTVIYGGTSDRRLKDNIVDLTNSGAFIDALKPREFTWKTNGMTDAGFIADEFQQVTPNSVIGEPNAVNEDNSIKAQQIDASTPEMIANIVAEIQSLRKRLADAGL